MADDVYFVDTTFRDGSQSLWAMGMRYGMREPIAGDMDRAGLFAIEVVDTGNFFKKSIRDLKEDPLDTLKMLAREMPHTLKVMNSGLRLVSLGPQPPRVVQELAYRMLADIVQPMRVQVICNTADQLTTSIPRDMPIWRSYGMKVALRLSYTISPRHTDELFSAQAHQAAAFRPDTIILKDQSGLLTVDRIRALAPMLLEAAGDIPVELHSHCTTGLAPSVYSEAMRLGIRYLHTGIPPACEGSAQPSVLDIAHNARVLGFNPVVDEALIGSISKRLASFARQEGLPFGAPLRYDEDQFRHQIPGGVISNLRYQLEQLGMVDRLEEVKREAVQVRAELGYPIVVTPYSQYIVTQSAINVATGKRWTMVIDEIIRYAQGAFGAGSGYEWMDPDLRDRILSLPRAREMAVPVAEVDDDEVTLKKAKELYGDVQMSDEELILRAVMGGSAEIEAMRNAAPPKRYMSADLPLFRLIHELESCRSIRFVHVERDGKSQLRYYKKAIDSQNKRTIQGREREA